MTSGSGGPGNGNGNASRRPAPGPAGRRDDGTTGRRDDGTTGRRPDCPRGRGAAPPQCGGEDAGPAGTAGAQPRPHGLPADCRRRGRDGAGGGGPGCTPGHAESAARSRHRAAAGRCREGLAGFEWCRCGGPARGARVVRLRPGGGGGGAWRGEPTGRFRMPSWPVRPDGGGGPSRPGPRCGGVRAGSGRTGRPPGAATFRRGLWPRAGPEADYRPMSRPSGSAVAGAT